MTHLLILIYRNLFRHKLRTFLTILAVAVAILSFGILRTVIDVWYLGVEVASANRLVTRNAISLIFSLPVSYREKIMSVDGVKSVSYGNWFGGIYIDEKNFFPNFAIEPKGYLGLYPELVLNEKEKIDFFKDRKSAIVGEKLAKRFGWKIGDTVTLKGTIFQGNWDFTIRGIYKGRDKNTDETIFFFHWDYLNEMVKKTMPTYADQTGFFVIGIKDASRAGEISQNIDSIFKNSLAETITETEKAFNMGFVAMTEAIVVVIELVSYIVIFIIMAVSANTMAMTVRERSNEYAVFKTLGFRTIHLLGLIFGESFLITMSGCLLGIALSFPIADLFSASLSEFFPVFNISMQTILFDVVGGCLIALTAAVFPSIKAINTDIANGLRKLI
ncbi:MAG: FtsX-like permease family protein [Thermodesulfovibrionales bacterium]|nr:FtsX-like permease family protein [Thermodesulfovibrionales bacterium]